LEYGFKPVRANHDIFLYYRGGEKLILSLYVDDGITATNSPALYKQFLSDLGTKFKLSHSRRLSWYLGVDIEHDKEKGITTMSQQKYVKIPHE